MGGVCPRGDRVEELAGAFGDDAEMLEVIDHWDLSPADVRYLHKRFRYFDADGSGNIDAEEFFSAVSATRSQFLVRLVLGDENELSFAQWAHSTLSFSLATHSQLAERVFACFDSRRSGLLGISEVHHLISDVHGDNALLNRSLVAAVTDQLLSQGGQLSFDDLSDLSTSHPLLLFPVFRLQHRVRKALGHGMLSRFTEETDDFHLWRKWRKRVEALQMFVFGWPCCPRRQEGPTPLIEISARKRAVRAARRATFRRSTRPQRRFRRLEGDHHDDTDNSIELFAWQADTRPIRDNELRGGPPTLSAIDQDGETFLVAPDGDSDSESDDLIELGPEEWQTGHHP